MVYVLLSNGNDASLCRHGCRQHQSTHVNADETKSNDKRNPIICMLCNNTSFDKPLSSQQNGLFMSWSIHCSLHFLQTCWSLSYTQEWCVFCQITSIHKSLILTGRGQCEGHAHLPVPYLCTDKLDTSPAHNIHVTSHIST